MTVMNVAAQMVIKDSFVREQETDAYRPRKLKKTNAKKELLEEEIRQLRKQMELVAQSENSFTSEIVIQLSVLLDEKINEYNTMTTKNKTQ